MEKKSNKCKQCGYASSDADVLKHTIQMQPVCLCIRADKLRIHLIMHSGGNSNKNNQLNYTITHCLKSPLKTQKLVLCIWFRKVQFLLLEYMHCSHFLLQFICAVHISGMVSLDVILFQINHFKRIIAHRCSFRWFEIQTLN